MATTIRLIEGFNAYSVSSDLSDTPAWHVANGTINLGGGRTYGNSYVIDSASDYAVHQLSNTTDKYLRVGFAVKSTNHAAAWDGLVTITSSTNYPNENYANGTIRIGAAGKLRLQAAHGNMIYETPSSVLNIGEWHYIEIGIYEHDTAGMLDLYVDGVLMHSATGLDTYYGAQQYIAFDTYDNANDFQLDDVYIAQDDTAIPAALGSVSVIPLLPNADTATADFTGTYADVDDPLGAASDGDTTYITAATVNAESRFEVEPLPAGNWTIHGVSVKGEMKKSDAGDRGAALTCTSGATTSTGATTTLSDAGYNLDSALFATNPDTGSQWTAAEIDSMQIGVKVTV